MSDLILTVYDGADRLDIVEGIESLQWLPEFCGAGEIKLVCAATAKNLSLLRQWRRLYNPDTPELAAVIVCVASALSDKGELRMTVRGYFGVWWWSRRACTGKRTVTDAAAGLLGIATECKRGLPVTLPDRSEIAAPCKEVVEWCDCLTAFTRLARAGGFGLRHTFDPATGGEALTILWGSDRSDQSRDSYRGYYGTAMQNLSNIEVSVDGSEYANVAVCYAEASERPTVIVEAGAVNTVGTERQELLVDGSSVEYGAGYEDALRSYAESALLGCLNTSEIKATADDTNLVFGRDYRLGDTLPVLVPELGLRASAQVESVKLIYERGGRTVQPIFGSFKLRGDDP